MTEMEIRGKVREQPRSVFGGVGPWPLGTLGAGHWPLGCLGTWVEGRYLDVTSRLLQSGDDDVRRVASQRFPRGIS